MAEWHELVIAAARDQAKLVELLTCSLGIAEAIPKNADLIVREIKRHNKRLEVVASIGSKDVSFYPASSEVLDHASAPQQLAVYLITRAFSGGLRANPEEVEVHRSALISVIELIHNNDGFVVTALPSQIVEHVVAGRNVAIFGKSASLDFHGT
jgi:hypothetical protein